MPQLAWIHLFVQSKRRTNCAASKGFWAEMLGVGDFYYELGIQIVESCLVVQETTGGLTDLDIIKKRISRLRGSNSPEVSE